jgi:hypothetical protein
MGMLTRYVSVRGIHLILISSRTWLASLATLRISTFKALQFLQMDSSTKAEGRAYHVDFLENQTTDSFHTTLPGAKSDLIDPELGRTKGLKITADQDGVLVPQPSDDPQDPLNWSYGKKNAVLAIVIACSFLPDYGSVTGAATLTLQAE